MRTNRIVCFLLLLILAAGCQTTQLSKVTFYYVPFQLESNEAVSPENIREKSNVVDVTDKRTLVYLEKLLAKAKAGAKFERKRVRFLLVMTPGDRSVWVDADGNLLEANAEQHLDRSNFDQL